MSVDFDEVRRKYPLLSYCERRGIVLKRKGNEFRGRCPIHNGNSPDSFAVYPDTGRWHCYSECGRGGDVIDLEQLLGGGGNITEVIARLEGIPVPLPPRAPPAERQSRKPAKKIWPWWEQLRLGSECELQRTAGDRRIKVEACRLAEARGLLRFIDTRRVLHGSSRIGLVLMPLPG